MSQAKHAVIKKVSDFPQGCFFFINSGKDLQAFSRDTKHNQITKIAEFSQKLFMVNKTEIS